MSTQKTMKLSERIPKAFKGLYFLRVNQKKGALNVEAIPPKLTFFTSTAKKHPDIIWLPCSRLMGTVADLKSLLKDASKPEFDLSDALCKVIEYELTHALTPSTVDSTQEREYWGYTESNELMKGARRSYKYLYETELSMIKNDSEIKKAEKVNSAYSVEFIKKVSHELLTKQGCYGVIIPNNSGHTIKEFRVGREQKRPTSVKDLLSRLKMCQEEGSYLNVSAMNENGGGTRVLVSKPRTAVEFPIDAVELRNVYWVPSEKTPGNEGAVNFLLKYHEALGKTLRRSEATQMVKRAVDLAPKQVSTRKEKVVKPLQVVEKTDLSLEPQSPRDAVVNYDGPDFM